MDPKTDIFVVKNLLEQVLPKRASALRKDVGNQIVGG
jgi:hypothetical protein